MCLFPSDPHQPVQGGDRDELCGQGAGTHAHQLQRTTHCQGHRSRTLFGPFRNWNFLWFQLRLRQDCAWSLQQLGKSCHIPLLQWSLPTVYQRYLIVGILLRKFKITLNSQPELVNSAVVQYIVPVFTLTFFLKTVLRTCTAGPAASVVDPDSHGTALILVGLIRIKEGKN